MVQEVFLTAHRRGGFEQRGEQAPTGRAAQATTWLAAIAVRTASNHRRSARRKRTVLDAERVDGAVATGGNPLATSEARESLRRVAEALDALDLDHRAVFVLYELEGVSCEGISEALSIPKGTVYSRLHHAREHFKRAHGKLVQEEASRSSRRAG